MIMKNLIKIMYVDDEPLNRLLFHKLIDKENIEVFLSHDGIGVGKIVILAADGAAAGTGIVTAADEVVQPRITSYNVCYTKLLR